jgi:hypothetical protein
MRGSAKDAAAYDSLHDGIPDWLKASVWHWIESALAFICETDNYTAQLVAGYDSNERHYRDLLLYMERELRLTLKWASVAAARKDLLQQAVNDPNISLDVMDLLLRFLSTARHDAHENLADGLDGLLYQGGSKWCVSATRDSLEERVATEAAERVAQLTTSGTRAGQHLREAWHGVYGRSPNPSHAYREAIRAVEAVAIPVVSPKHAKATLGTVIGDMKAAPHKRTVTLQPAKGDPVQHVIGMMELLWTAQIDRHGTADESVPLTASRDEAEAAVHLALTLTHWFQTGVVR